eukprot:scaffold206601_cov43-Prasinocladus_malaysianus.AAC.2
MDSAEIIYLKGPSRFPLALPSHRDASDPEFTLFVSAPNPEVSGCRGPAHYIIGRAQAAECSAGLRREKKLSHAALRRSN